MWICVQCRLKLNHRCCQSPHFEPVNMFKEKEKVLKKCTAPVCITAYSFFFHVPSDLLSLKSHRSAPLPRTIITLVCDPRWVAGREMNSHVGLQGLEYYFVRTNTACSSPHSFTSSDWCWQFPQTKLCHSKTWSMAPISQILTSIRPRSNLFLPTTKNFWCPYSTQSSSRTTFFTGIPLLLHPFLIPAGVQYTYSRNHNFSLWNESIWISCSVLEPSIWTALLCVSCLTKSQDVWPAAPVALHHLLGSSWGCVETKHMEWAQYFKYDRAECLQIQQQ